MNKFFREITDDYGRLPWSSDKTSYGQCHWGQRKLLYSEIEFLLYCAEHTNLSTCVVLYVGSAPGTHINILIQMFPMVRWLLYDPRKFDINRKYIDSGAVEIHTGNDGFFTDAHIQKVLDNPFTKDKKILFVSDIRFNTYEKQIFEENINQQKWLIKLNAFAYILKLRMMYDYKKKFEYDISDIKDKLDMSNLVVPNNLIGKFLYLDGHTVTQLYAPIYSCEGRLFGKIGSDNKYKCKYYDYEKYEEHMMYFNEVSRQQKFSYKDSEKVKHHILEFGDTYDNVGEYYLIRKYQKIIKKKYKFRHIIKALYRINKKMCQLTRESFVPCTYISFIKLHKILEDSKKNISNNSRISKSEKTELLQEDISMQKIILKAGLARYNVIKSDLEMQKNKWFPEGDILKKSTYNKQIIKATSLISEVDKIIDRIQKLIKYL